MLPLSAEHKCSDTRQACRCTLQGWGTGICQLNLRFISLSVLPSGDALDPQGTATVVRGIPLDQLMHFPIGAFRCSEGFLNSGGPVRCYSPVHSQWNPGNLGRHGVNSMFQHTLTEWDAGLRMRSVAVAWFGMRGSMCLAGCAAGPDGYLFGHYVSGRYN